MFCLKSPKGALKFSDMINFLLVHSFVRRLVYSSLAVCLWLRYSANYYGSLLVAVVVISVAATDIRSVMTIKFTSKFSERMDNKSPMFASPRSSRSGFSMAAGKRYTIIL